MKEDFNNEKKLANLLEAYKVDIPTKKLATKQSMYQCFILYLASQTQ